MADSGDLRPDIILNPHAFPSRSRWTQAILNTSDSEDEGETEQVEGERLFQEIKRDGHLHDPTAILAYLAKGEVSEGALSIVFQDLLATSARSADALYRSGQLSYTQYVDSGEPGELREMLNDARIKANRADRAIIDRLFAWAIRQPYPIGPPLETVNEEAVLYASSCQWGRSPTVPRYLLTAMYQRDPNFDMDTTVSGDPTVTWTEWGSPSEALAWFYRELPPQVQARVPEGEKMVLDRTWRIIPAILKAAVTPNLAGYLLAAI